jgi:hypothetical protein
MSPASRAIVLALVVRILSSLSNEASAKATVGKAEVCWAGNDHNEHEVIGMSAQARPV